MFYTPKGFVFENKVQKPLKEGGKAAETLITAKLDTDGSKGLKFSKIPKQKLEYLFKKISQLLSLLKEKELIEDVEPSYQLGSTRLARYSLTNDLSLLKPGEQEILDTALEKKTSFGDLDIDVEFKKDPDNLVEFINSLEDSAALKGNNQIHLALADGTDVYQVDLVNVKNKKELYSFKEKSSFIDLAQSIKGAFSIILLRALASTKDVSKAAEEVFNDQVKLAGQGDKNAEKIVKAASLNRVPTKVRYSLGDEGLVLKLVLEDDPNNPPEKPRKPKELGLSEPAKYSYKNLDELAQYLLDDETATGNDIYHAVLLAEKIKNLPNKQDIWEYFLGSAEINLKKGISEEDYNTGIEELKKIIFPENNSSTISEGRKGIGRFVGSSKFTGKGAFSVLKDIAKNSTLENNKLIINFNKDNIFLVEKMDSSFCHFGIDPKGKFFFEAKNSKEPVYSDTADKELGYKIDFIDTFRDLENNKNFQKSLKTIFNKFGSFKFSAELFPVLTHKGTKDGQIIFVGVPYSRDKFGTKGGFVIFNVNLLNNQGSYQAPDYKLDNEITSEFKRLSQEDGWDNQWKVYTNNQDMKKSSEDLEIELEPELFEALNNNSEYSKKLKDSVMKAGEQIQEFLDTKANKFSSNLSSKKDNSYIEGLVLKVIDEKGNITEVKGTSSSFDEKVKVYWQDRDAISGKPWSLKTVLQKELLEDVLKLKTTDPGKLNREITKLGKDFEPNNSSSLSLKQQFYNYFLNNLTDLGPEIKNPKEVKSRATEVIENITKEYSKLLKDFKANQKNLDQDSIRKTDEYFDSFKEEFLKIKNSINKDSDKNYLFNLLNSIIGSRIDNRVNFDPGQEEENDRENVIIWNGRAQPWHFGHHAMIEKGISNLKNTNSDKVLIFLVKGSGGPTKENPLTFDQQLSLLNSIYADNKNVEVAQEPLGSSFFLDPINALHDLNYNLTGWLAGPDRIEDYKNNLRGFNVSSYKKDHNFSPISRNSKGLLDLTLIPTERKFSGTDSRNIALEKPFEEWLSEITQGMNLSNEAKQNYKIAYEQIRKVNNVPDESNLEQPVPAAEQSAPPFSSESSPDNSEESLEEMSTMGAGAVAGAPGRAKSSKKKKRTSYPTIYREMQENYFIQREDLMEEIKLRKAIRNIITENKKKELNEEQRLRKVIRKMLTEAKQANEVVYQNTGINKLRDLLRNIIPTIRDDYKDLTTSREQREAFKNYLITGINNILGIADLSKSSDKKSEPDLELEEDIDIEVKSADPSKIDLGLNKKEKPEPPPEELDSRTEEEKLVSDETPSDPDQLTGMRQAASTLQKIKNQTLDAYESLSNPEDEKSFKEFIAANIDKHLEDFEAEITPPSDVEVEKPEGSVETDTTEAEPQVEDQIELSESLLKKLANFV